MAKNTIMRDRAMLKLKNKSKINEGTGRINSPSKAKKPKGNAQDSTETDLAHCRKFDGIADRLISI